MTTHLPFRAVALGGVVAVLYGLMPEWFDLDVWTTMSFGALGMAAGDGMAGNMDDWTPRWGEGAAADPARQAQKAAHEAEREVRREKQRVEREQIRAKKRAEREVLREEKRKEKARRRRMRMPLSSFGVFLPCVAVDFIPAVMHATIYNEVLRSIGDDLFVSQVPVLGRLTEMVDPDLTFSGVLVLLMCITVLLAPVFFFHAWSRLGISQDGFDVFEDEPMAVVELGLPLIVYVGSGFLEFGMLWRRLEMKANEVVVFGAAKPIDTEVLLVTAVLTFIATSVVGYWASIKLKTFLEEKKQRMEDHSYKSTAP